MNLMKAEEISKLKREFDEYVDSAILRWAEDSVAKIENQIKAKNTGIEKFFEGKIQISPYKFYISEELTAKIKDSQKSFHTGGDMLESMFDEFFEDSYYGDVGRIELYNMVFLSEQNLKIINDINGIFRPNRYLACFGVSLERSFVEEQRGWIFKRTVRVEREVWRFEGISLQFLKKLEAICKDAGIEILGAEIVYYNKDVSSFTPIVHKMDNIFESYVCKNAMGSSKRAVILKWRYRVS